MSMILITAKMINAIGYQKLPVPIMRTTPNTIATNIKNPNIKPVPTWSIARSHQVFLKSIDDSFIASCGDFSWSIMRGNAKKVRIFHAHPTSPVMMFHMVEFFPTLSWIILSIRLTVELISDQMRIALRCFIDSLIPSPKLISFPSILFCTEVIIAVLKKKATKENTK